MKNFIILIVIAVLICGGLGVIKIQHKDEEQHSGLSVGMLVKTNSSFSEIYGYSVFGKIQELYYREPGRETSLYAVINGEDVPIYLIHRVEQY